MIFEILNSELRQLFPQIAKVLVLPRRVDHQVIAILSPFGDNQVIENTALCIGHQPVLLPIDGH